MPPIDMTEFGAEKLEDLPEGLDFGDDVVEDEDIEDEAAETEEVEEVEEEVEETADEETDDASDDEEESTEAQADAEGEEASKKPDAAAETKGKGKEPFIPKSRMDQALRKARAAEQRALELENQLAELAQQRAEADAPKPLTAEEIKTKMAAANEALVAGDTEKAAELQAELMASMVTRPEAPKAKTPERDMLSEIEERLEFKQTLKDIYTRFPQLDENGEQFDETLGEEAVDLQQAYMRRGYTMAEATRKAAEAVAKLHDLDDAAAPAPQAPAKVAAAKTKQSAKTKEKLAKATKAAPPLAGSRGDAEDVAFDIFSATEEEFMALPKAVQDRLLGNTI